MAGREPEQGGNLDIKSFGRWRREGRMDMGLGNGMNGPSYNDRQFSKNLHHLGLTTTTNPSVPHRHHLRGIPYRLGI